MQEQPSVEQPVRLQIPHEHIFLDVPWTLRDLLLALGLGLMTSIGLMLVLALGVAVHFGDKAPPYLLGTLSILPEFSLLLPVWWLGIGKYRLGWQSVGFRPFRMARGLGLGCLFLLVSFAANVLWSILLAQFHVEVQQDPVALFGPGGRGLALALFVGAVAAPIAEETFFRGFLFSGLHSRWGYRKAALLSALVFALFHFEPASIPPLFVLGVLFAALYAQTGSIWPAVILHGASNALALLAAYATMGSSL